MNDANVAIPQEAYHVLAEVLTGIGFGFGIWGIRNLLEGYGNGNPKARELGMRQIKAGANLAVIAAYIEKGTLPPPEMIGYLPSRWTSQ